MSDGSPADRTVLLIEDEQNITEAITFLLNREGWRVVRHTTGTDAIELIRSRRPDLVILDVMLPGRSGFDILADIRRDPSLSALPVMMLTARGQARDRALAEAGGASHFMTKPFANAELIEAARHLLGEVSNGQG